MNPSRLFIERPVATTLLMIAILMVGVAAYKFLPLSALPEVDYPTIQVQTFYPGASPEVMTSSVTAPLERQFGQMPSSVANDVAKLGGRLGHHPALQPRSEPRHRRTGSSGGDQRRRQSVAGRSSRAADLRQGQPGRRADPDPRRDLEDAEADGCRGHRRKPARAEAVAASRRRPGVDFGRSAAGGAHPRQSAGARRLRAQSRRSQNDHRQSQRQYAEGQFRRSVAVLRHQRQRPDPQSQRLPQFGRRLPQQRAGPAERRRHRGDRGGEQPAFRLDERDAGADRQHPAPAGRERHPGRRQHQAPCCRR